jgi:ABC-type multidrug transport system ATPase subunit
MKTCGRCHAPNAEVNCFCQQCGRPLDLPPEGPEQTVAFSGTTLPERAPRKFVSVNELFGKRDRLVIGRASDCDVCLPHPSVSRYHAILDRTTQGVRLRDLGSKNGVSITGRRITEPTQVKEGEQVGIGPYLFTLRGGVIQSLDSSRSLRLEAQALEKVVSVGDRQVRKLLSEINVVINPGEFVTLLGPSGSGKSTLMDCLNGRRRATGGKVLANGEDFYRHFDNFRQSLGYVPQKDIVHTHLSVYRALYYTARLRLPRDTSRGELHARLDQVLVEMELHPHRDTLIGNLSGGQIKRVSLGAELLADPCLLYIDEATSGLDAGTEARMMRLFRRLSDEGRSIICITHNVENVDQCHLILVLCRGRLVFCGPPRDAPGWFGAHRISDIYDRLAERPPEEWAQRFQGSHFHREYIQERLAAGSTEPPSEAATLVSILPTKLNVSTSTPTDAAPTAEGAPTLSPAPSTRPEKRSGLWEASMWMAPLLADRIRALTTRVLRLRALFAPLKDTWHQVRVLTARYIELIRGDARSLRLLLWQAPLVAFFLLVGFLGQNFRGTLPVPRELNASERRVLAAMVALDHLVHGTSPTAEEQAALQNMQCTVELAGVKQRMEVGSAVQELHKMQSYVNTRAALAALSTAKFTLHTKTGPVTLTASDLAAVTQGMHDSHLPAKLLALSVPVVPDHETINPRHTYMLLFLLVMVVLWFGCNNAAKEIVKEESIYGRERAVNLGIFPYLASKFIVMTVLTILQMAVLLVLVYSPMEMMSRVAPGWSAPPAELRADYLTQFGVLSVLSACGVALGLFLSACVSTPDRANALLPYVLIPQIILGGGIMAVDGSSIRYLAWPLSPVYWSYRAMHRGANALPPFMPGHSDIPEGSLWPTEVLLIQTVVLLLLTAWFLKQKDA